MRAYSLKEIYESLSYGDEHNYVLFPEMKNTDVCKSESSAIKLLCKEITQAAEKAACDEITPLKFSEFIEYEKNGIRHHFEDSYRKNLCQLVALVLSDFINKEDKYTEKIQDCLWQWMNEYTWEFPAHIALRPEDVCFLRREGDVATGLFSATMAVVLSEIMTAMGDKLHPMLKSRIKKEIDKRILKPYMSGLQFWEGGGYNWAAVCAGAIGMTAIYSDMEFTDLCFVISRVIAAFTSYFETMESDGSCREGLGYWGYGFSFFTFFACLLKERTCGKIDLFDDDFVRKTACFPLIMQYPDGYIVNYADTPANKYVGGLGFFTRLSEIIGKSYKIPETVPLAGWMTTTRDLFWGSSSEKIKNQEILTGDYWYNNSQIMVSRGFTAHGDFFAFSAKGGHNHEPHNHNDVGQFLINIENCPVIIDIGAPLYTKETFEDETRYKILQCSSASHNVPEIDGVNQMHGVDYCARNVYADKGSLTMDIAAAYPAGTAEKIKRSFFWNQENACVVVRDEFSFNDGGHGICERIAIGTDAKIENGFVILDCGKYEFEIFSKTDADDIKITKHSYIDNVNRKSCCSFAEFNYTVQEKNFVCEIHFRGKLKDGGKK